MIFFGVKVGLLSFSYFALYDSKTQAIYTEKLFQQQQKSTKNFEQNAVSLSFLSWGCSLDFRNPGSGSLKPNILFLLILFFSIKLQLEGMLGLSGSNKRNPGSGLRIPFARKGLVGLCCEDGTGEKKECSCC